MCVLRIESTQFDGDAAQLPPTFGGFALTTASLAPSPTIFDVTYVSRMAREVGVKLEI